MMSFSEFIKEEVMPAAANSVGSGNVALPADAGHPKKKRIYRRKPLTKNYVEVNGKRKLRWK